MTDETGIPKITMANTKKEMLAAYKQMREQLQARPAPLPDPAETRKEEEARQAVEVADERAEDDVLAGIQALRLAIGRELESLASKLDDETDAYRQVKRAVAAKQAELKQAFEVESAAIDLAALLEAQRERKERFETEMAETRAAWERERSERQAELDAERERLERDRSWEAEQHAFEQKREQVRRRNALEEELAELRGQVEDLRAEAARLREQKETELTEREAALAKREERLAELEALEAAAPAALQEARGEAATETEARLEASHAAKEALLTKEFEGERNVLASRIEALETLVAQQKAQIDTLARQQDTAYEKLQDIASKAVEGARRDAPTYRPGAGGGGAEGAEG